jgi:hypothetical protein
MMDFFISLLKVHLGPQVGFDGFNDNTIKGLTS